MVKLTLNFNINQQKANNLEYLSKKVLDCLNKLSSEVDSFDVLIYMLKNTLIGKKAIMEVGDDKLNVILNNIKELYNNSELFKPSLLSTVANEFSCNELKKIGFKISPERLSNARSINKNNKGALKKPKKVTPIKAISDTVKEKINQFLFNNSECTTLSSLHDTSLDADKYNPSLKYTYTLTKTELYKNFLETHPDITISKSKFFKLFPKNFKPKKK